MKSFICLVNSKKEKETDPDYRLTANFGTKEQPVYRDVGCGWKKEGEKGKFISFQLNKPYQDKKGYELVEEGQAVKSPTSPQEPQGSTNPPKEDEWPI